MTYNLRDARRALMMLFFLPGVALASWVTRTPEIRDSLKVSLSEMGLVLFGLSVGSMTGILLSGWLVDRAGTRRVTVSGQILVCLSMAAIAFGTVLGSPAMVATGLGIFGGGIGLSEISMNVDGGSVERDAHKPFLHTLHGFFSLGTVAGAVAGMAMTYTGVPVVWHLAAITLLSSVLLLYAVKTLPRDLDSSATVRGPAEKDGQAVPFYRDLRLVLIGFIVLAMAMAEGTANDWLPILMVDEHGFSPTSGSLIYLTFAVTMTVGRFSGGWFLQRLGRADLLVGCATLGAIGLATIALTHSPVLAWLSVMLWGLGASLGFPVAISAAGASGENPAARVKFVAMAGYLAFLVGPPFLGVLGETIGLRAAMGVIIALLLIVAVMARFVIASRRSDA